MINFVHKPGVKWKISGDKFVELILFNAVQEILFEKSIYKKGTGSERNGKGGKKCQGGMQRIAGREGSKISAQWIEVNSMFHILQGLL